MTHPLHQSWLDDEATARQRQVAEALLAAAERLRQSINQRRAQRQEVI